MHYIEAWEDNWATLCGKMSPDDLHTTQNPLIVTCKSCIESMKTAGTFTAMRMKLDRLQGIQTKFNKPHDTHQRPN